jgi:hypothetical protein
MGKGGGRPAKVVGHRRGIGHTQARDVHYCYAVSSFHLPDLCGLEAPSMPLLFCLEPFSRAPTKETCQVSPYKAGGIRDGSCGKEN